MYRFAVESFLFFFFFQAEDGIRDLTVTGVQTCALPISVIGSGGLDRGAIFDLFPNLRERLRTQGTKLSGGEQQMLAIGRILRTGARLLLLDEPTEGLAPVIVQQIGATIRRLQAEGFTLLLA